ncbi:MAG: hypothetical protein JXA10_07210, partial [Anaerolineae bacterium]|nr:hypothetical protein [Anaerolineae bacterium]
MMQNFSGVSRAWLALAAIVGGVVAAYLALSVSISADPLLMPLDDTYIHFQYARQMAEGHPFVYNTGDPATSGGTSLLYPPLLAAGYLLGFTGWALAYWALALGIVFFLGSAWLIYRIGSENPLKPGHPDQTLYAFWLAVAFALSGPVIWAALSGMETALFVFAVLLTLYAMQRGQFRWTLFAATLMTLTRPEGVILAGIAVVGLALLSLTPPSNPLSVYGEGGSKTQSDSPSPCMEREAGGEVMRRLLLLSIPILAAGIQPALNILATGSASSSGMVAKSRLYNTGAPFGERLESILNAFGRMWVELFTGHSPDFGTFT